jgi:hypothetical protein
MSRRLYVPFVRSVLQTFTHDGRQRRVFVENSMQRGKKQDRLAKESEFELRSPLFLQFPRTELLGTGSEKQDPNFTQCFSTKNVGASNPSDIRALCGQIRAFGQNRPETEKNHDCVAEESEFELVGPLVSRNKTSLQFRGEARHDSPPMFKVSMPIRRG